MVFKILLISQTPRWRTIRRCHSQGTCLKEEAQLRWFITQNLLHCRQRMWWSQKMLFNKLSRLTSRTPSLSIRTVWRPCIEFTRLTKVTSSRETMLLKGTNKKETSSSKDNWFVNSSWCRLANTMRCHRSTWWLTFLKMPQTIARQLTRAKSGQDSKRVCLFTTSDKRMWTKFRLRKVVSK